MEHRQSRLASLIREELSADILRFLEFPGSLVTITEVELSHKLDAATVHVSVIPEEKGALAIETLERNRRQMERRLLRRLRIRVMPELTFRQDHGPANAAAVDKILSENPLGDPLSDQGLGS